MSMNGRALGGAACIAAVITVLIGCVRMETSSGSNGLELPHEAASLETTATRWQASLGDSDDEEEQLAAQLSDADESEDDVAVFQSLKGYRSSFRSGGYRSSFRSGSRSFRSSSRCLSVVDYRWHTPCVIVFKDGGYGSRRSGFRSKKSKWFKKSK